MRKDIKVSAPAPSIARTQESTVKNNVPLKLDIKLGDNWLDTKDVV